MRPRNVRFEIRVRGHLGETMRRAFPDLDARTDGGDTLLTGPVCDQPALHGALAQVESLGLELLEVRRVPAGAVEQAGVRDDTGNERFK